MGLLIFHAFDETALDRFQSGLYYPDETPKSSLPTVRDAARDVRGGVIAKCDGLELTPKAKVAYPRIAIDRGRNSGHRRHLRHRLHDLRAARAAAAALDHAALRAPRQAGERTLAKFRKPRLAPGPLPLHRSADRAGEPWPAARARERPVDSPLDPIAHSRIERG